jgi:hypothetical protein
VLVQLRKGEWRIWRSADPKTVLEQLIKERHAASSKASKQKGILNVSSCASDDFEARFQFGRLYSRLQICPKELEEGWEAPDSCLSTVPTPSLP